MDQSSQEIAGGKSVATVLAEKSDALSKIGAMVNFNVPPETTEYKAPTEAAIAKESNLVSLQGDMKTLQKGVDPGLAKATVNADPRLIKLAGEKVNLLFSKGYDSQAKRTAVDSLGVDVQKKAFRLSVMLEEPTRTLFRSKEGRDVGNGLVELKQKMLELDPAKFGLSTKALQTMLVKSKVGKAVDKYWTKSQSEKTIINTIVASLNEGSSRLQRDNDIYANDQEAMRKTTFELQDAILVVSLMDKEIQRRLTANEITDPEEKKFVINELQFPVRQRIMSLQQTLLSAQQVVLSSGVMIGTNRELVRATNDATTISVMQLGNVLSLITGLYHQRDQLDKIKGLNSATEKFMLIGAELLDTQVTEINTLAAQCMISLDVIETCMGHVHSAINKVSTFRQNALEPMGQSITRMEGMIDKNEEEIKRVEKGEKVRGSLNLGI